MTDTLDLRDIIERFEELKELGYDNLDQDDKEGYKNLESLLEELEGCGGDEQYNGSWYPITLINEDYFEQAMDELIEDCYCDVIKPDNLPPFIKYSLDYDMLRMDYSEVEYCGETYLYR